MFLIPFKFPNTEVHCVFTTRQGGVSSGNYGSLNISFDVLDNIEHVEKNREKVCKSLGLSKLVDVKQVHGDNIVEILRHDSETKIYEADAMISKMKNIGLLIKTADCQPLLICDAKGQYIGAFHVGWRANRGNFIKKWINTFCETYCIKPEDILAIRGPSLCPEHSEFINFVNEWSDKFKKYYDPTTKCVDLWSITYNQLKRVGVKEKNIFTIDLCTYCNKELFFSYRRDKICGRQGGIIWING